MRWIAKVSQKHVLNMLLNSHEKEDPEEKYAELVNALHAGEQYHWWYRILKSHCDDYNNGAIVGYDEPLPDVGLQGLKETDHGYVFFKKADTHYLGRSPMRVEMVEALVEAESK